jgi:hypothetical protein
MIGKDQIVFASQIVKDFNDFQIPAGGKVQISVSIAANPLFTYAPGTYVGKILVIANSTELTVPMIVDLKPSDILEGALSGVWDGLVKYSAGIATVLSIIGLLGLFFGGATLHVLQK